MLQKILQFFFRPIVDAMFPAPPKTPRMTHEERCRVGLVCEIQANIRHDRRFHYWDR